VFLKLNTLVAMDFASVSLIGEFIIANSIALFGIIGILQFILRLNAE
jgi:hypothetical protein